MHNEIAYHLLTDVQPDFKQQYTPTPACHPIFIVQHCFSMNVFTNWMILLSFTAVGKDEILQAKKADIL